MPLPFEAAGAILVMLPRAPLLSRLDAIADEPIIDLMRTLIPVD
jgi:hypothetical protein